MVVKLNIKQKNLDKEKHLKKGNILRDEKRDNNTTHKIQNQASEVIEEDNKAFPMVESDGTDAEEYFDKELKYLIFQNELELIDNDDIRLFIEEVLKKAPSYFYTVAASKSGKFHPDFAHGDGGLIRHIKATIQVLYNIIENTVLLNTIVGKPYLEPVEQDICIAALLIHDLCKYDMSDTEGRFRKSHNAMVIDFVNKNIDLSNYKKILKEIDQILGAVYYHMAEWGGYKNGGDPMKECTGLKLLVQMSDYFSSLRLGD